MLQSVPSFRLYLHDSQFRAIGHVIVQWAFLEQKIDRELDWLNRRCEHKRHRASLSAKLVTRVRRWREMAALAYKHFPERVSAVEGISNRVLPIKDELNEFIRGSFISGGIIEYVSDGIDVSNMVDSGPRIEDLACRISAINAELENHQYELDHLFEDTPF